MVYQRRNVFVKQDVQDGPVPVLNSVVDVIHRVNVAQLVKMCLIILIISLVIKRSMSPVFALANGFLTMRKMLIKYKGSIDLHYIKKSCNRQGKSFLYFVNNFLIGIFSSSAVHLNNEFDRWTKKYHKIDQTIQLNDIQRFFQKFLSNSAKELSYSFCYDRIVEKNSHWHCRKCQKCAHRREWHCCICNKCKTHFLSREPEMHVDFF